jgi:hypothetical protein
MLIFPRKIPRKKVGCQLFPPASITDKSPRQAQLLKTLKTGITETGITGVGTRGAGTSEFQDN